MIHELARQAGIAYINVSMQLCMISFCCLNHSMHYPQVLCLWCGGPWGPRLCPWSSLHNPQQSQPVL